MPITICAEIGINHNGDVNRAIDLIDMAHDCDPGVVVKFQKRTPRICVPKHMWDRPKETPWGVMTYIQYKERLEFEKQEYDIINAHCSQKGVRWTASVWDLPSLEFLMQYDVPFIKIPSALLTNDELIQAARQTERPIVMSTGMSTGDEIRHAVTENFTDTDDLTLLHCNSSYPTKDHEENLRAIEMLLYFFMEEYGYPFIRVGYSSHNVSPFVPLAAATLGAEFIEAHVTLDRAMWGSDQAASLEKPGFSLLCREIRRLPIIMGDGSIGVWPSEREKRKSLRGE